MAGGDPADGDLIAAAVRRWRRDQRLSLAAAGTLLGVSASAIRDWERAARPQAFGYARLYAAGVLERHARSGSHAGAMVRDARVRAGMSCTQLARRAGVHVTLVSRWENGSRSFRGENALSVCRLLGLDPDALAVRPAPPRVAAPGLKQARTARPLSQQQLADAIGVHVDTVGSWERGFTAPTARQITALAGALDVCPADLSITAPSAAPAFRGLALRRARRRTGLSQGRAAKLLGVSIRTYAAFEQGSRPPTYGQLRRLAAIYDVAFGTLAAAARMPPPVLLTRRRPAPGTMGPLLVELRSWHGMSRRTVAELALVTGRQVGRWERGQARPSLRACRHLEKAFGLRSGLLEASR